MQTPSILSARMEDTEVVLIQDMTAIEHLPPRMIECNQRHSERGASFSLGITMAACSISSFDKASPSIEPKILAEVPILWCVGNHLFEKLASFTAVFKEKPEITSLHCIWNWVGGLRSPRKVFERTFPVFCLTFYVPQRKTQSFAAMSLLVTSSRNRIF